MSVMTYAPEITAVSIPGSPPYSLLGKWGNLLSFARDPFNAIWKLHRQYGDMVSLVHGSTQRIFVFNHALNRQVLNNPDQFEVVDMPFAVPDGSSLARLLDIPGQVNGEKSRRLRLMMHKSLHHRFYGRYYGRLQQHINHTLSQWQVGQTRDIFADMVNLTTETPVTALFALDVAGNGRRITQLLHQWGNALLNSNTRLLPYDLPGSSFRRLLRTSEQLEQVYRALIQQALTQSLDEDTPLNVLLRIHTQTPDKLSESELLGLVNNLFNSGNTSRAVVVSWTLFLLAQHTAVLEQIQTELQTITQGQSPTYDQLAQLPTLQNAIKESLRLLPPMNWMPRRVISPVYLDGYAVPTGSMVMVSPFVSHRQPDLYPEPDCFLPDRWQIVNPAPFAYLPFGAGPRMCLGKEIAVMEITLIIAMILQRFRLYPAPNAVIDRTGFALSAPNQMLMRLTMPDMPLVTTAVHGNIYDLISIN